MARVSRLSGTAILDTSWLLELYRVPRYFDESRTTHVLTETARLIDAKSELFVTVPVLFEVASHITHVRNGDRRRILAERLRDQIASSIARDRPWTIAAVGQGILFRSQDVIRLAERFLESSGPNYSFAGISTIDLAAELRPRGRRVKILTFHAQLESYSD